MITRLAENPKDHRAGPKNEIVSAAVVQCETAAAVDRLLRYPSIDSAAMAF
jgi:hypothetical protein